jgi:Raf kinase inhibitor-like YbhB/YbcL family protein
MFRRSFAVESLLLGLALPAAAFELHSPDIAEGGTLARAQLHSEFGCRGDNPSPALTWTHAPAGTRSFALTVYDPDAPTGSGWWHWAVFDIPATQTSLARGIGRTAALPAGARQALNDFGTAGYGGACPPAGDKPHRYAFAIHALKVEHLDVPPDASASWVGAAIDESRIGQASIITRYGR